MSSAILTLNDIVDKSVAPGIGTITDGDTTPAVTGLKVLETSNSASTTITDFDDGSAGQEITIIFKDANTTIQSNANIKLQSGQDFGPAAVDDTLTLVLNTAGVWVEKCRQLNS